jgi:hypothetical protein
MGFSRLVHPAVQPADDALSQAMAGIGMKFGVRAAMQPNIEDTLLFASIEAMERDDLRVLAVLVTWFGIHAPWVNADRLTRLVGAESSSRVRALWSALSQGREKERRFSRLAKLHEGTRVDLLETGMDFRLRRNGEDPRFARTVLRVPAKVLRDRETDALTPTELAERHRAYRWRVIIGPSYRADMWAALDADPKLSSAELARRTYGSFATAWRVKRDFVVFEGSGGGRPSKSSASG